eukprot:14051862-Alexandrium_andersonii.AAC.1
MALPFWRVGNRRPRLGPGWTAGLRVAHPAPVGPPCVPEAGGPGRRASGNPGAPLPDSCGCEPRM